MGEGQPDNLKGKTKVMVKYTRKLLLLPLRAQYPKQILKVLRDTDDHVL